MMLGPCKDILSQIQFDTQENFTPEQIERFEKDAVFYREFLKATEKEVNSNFPIVSRNCPGNPSILRANICGQSL